MSESQHSENTKTVSSDKSRKAVKSESVMKAQAWVSGIDTQNPNTSVTGYTGSTHQLVQSQLTTSLHHDGVQLADRGSRPAVCSVVSSLIQPSVALTASSSLPPILSPNDPLMVRTAVENILDRQSSTVVTGSANVIALATPMKRVDSISASAAHLTTSTVDTQSVRHPSSTRRLHYEHYGAGDMARSDYGQNDRYTKQTDGSNFGRLPQVRSTVEHRSTEAADLQEMSSEGAVTMRQQTAPTTVGVRDSWHSAALANSAIDHESISAETLSSAPTPVLTVYSQPSASQSVDASHVSSLQIPAKNARLNELWYRFSQDHSVCSPHAAVSASSLNISRMERTDSDVVQRSRYQSCQQSVVNQAAGDNSLADNQHQQTSSSQLISSNSLGHISLPLSHTTNIAHAGHHTTSFDSGHVSQHNTETLHSSHKTLVNVENRPTSGKPSESDDAGKIPSLSASVPVRHAWIVKDEALPVVPEDTTLDSMVSDFTPTSSVDGMGNIITRTTKRHLPNDPKLLRLQQKIAQQREKHRQVRQNEQRRKEHIVKMELALRERQKAIEHKTEHAKKTEGDHRPSPNRLEMSTSSGTLTAVTSNDSDMTLCSSSLQPGDHYSTNNSELLSASDTSGSCSCHQAHCELQRLAVMKAKDVSLQKRHKSDTTFRPKLSEVKYTKSRVTKSAPVLSHETSSNVRERNATTKSVGRKVPASHAAYRTRIPEPITLKHAQGDRKVPSRTNKSAVKATLSKANYTNRILTEKNRQVTAERRMQSKAVQTTPHLRDNRVLYASTSVQCPAVSSHFDDMGVITLPVVSRGQHLSSLSSNMFSPDSSSDAEILQRLKHKTLMKRPVRAALPRELTLVSNSNC